MCVVGEAGALLLVETPVDAGFWSGLIDDIQIYDEVLSAEEVAEMAR